MTTQIRGNFSTTVHKGDIQAKNGNVAKLGKETEQKQLVSVARYQRRGIPEDIKKPTWRFTMDPWPWSKVYMCQTRFCNA